MRKGDIVRHCTQSGIQTGPYLRIVSIKRDFAVVEPIRKSIMQPYKLFKSNLAIIKMRKLQITDEAWKRLYYARRLTSISHSATAAWMRLYKEQAQLVQFRNFDFPNDIMIFSIDNIIRRTNLWRTGEDIRIELKERLV